MRRRVGVASMAMLLSIASVACAPAPLVQLVVRDATPRTIALQVRKGARVNARLAPAVEFQDGSVVRLTTGQVDSIGDYFVEAPHAAITAAPGTPVTLRASVCVDDERLCRTVEQRTTLP